MPLSCLSDTPLSDLHLTSVSWLTPLGPLPFSLSPSPLLGQVLPHWPPLNTS